MNNLSEDKINGIIKLREEGKTFSFIMKKIGCTKNTIIKYLKMYTEYKPYIPIKLNDELKKKIQDRYDEIGNIKTVAKEFNISYERLSKFILLKKVNKKKKNTYVYRQKVKQQLIDYKGGKCQICGYDRYVGALEFHHLNPKEKDFNISGGTKSFKHLKDEVDKCILVCSNCHREIHAGIIKLDTFIPK